MVHYSGLWVSSNPCKGFDLSLAPFSQYCSEINMQTIGLKRNPMNVEPPAFGTLCSVFLACMLILDSAHSSDACPQGNERLTASSLLMKAHRYPRWAKNWFLIGNSCSVSVCEAYWLHEEEMPDVEIDIDDLLDADSEEERASKLQEALVDCYKPTEVTSVKVSKGPIFLKQRIIINECDTLITLTREGSQTPGFGDNYKLCVHLLPLVQARAGTESPGVQEGWGDQGSK
ncbi:Protein phosphatase 1 regulatory subunit 14C [Fukomys damarensis]|uniref:Protein phosphatase 1 regulatory subunit 14 n=1 Tax=Fukomys damarensis TaxID=885580 RepID=A0A091CQK5_FUKDA|nr:Protein phosphatase 1 regulatory subunit 14C [Fukomys damarensis]